MEIPVYLAMTAAEFRICDRLPNHPAWLSCLFSPYGRGLSNIPKQIPPNSLLILSDRTPICGHDPELVYDILADAITRLSCSGLLLDFERMPTTESGEIVDKLTTLPCPVAVSAAHAKGSDCPVFVSYLPPSEPLESHLDPWKGREIWLEVSTIAQEITVNSTGSACRYAATPTSLPQQDRNLICHYGINIQENDVSFTVRRTVKDVLDLLEASRSFGVSKGIGLYQEFHES